MEIKNFLDNDIFSEFFKIAYIIDSSSTLPCLKNNWYYTSDGKRGNITRFYTVTKESDNVLEQEFHPEFEKDIQEQIYFCLKKVLENYSDKIEQAGKSMVGKNFDIGETKIEFQYTDTLKSHRPHKHDEDLNGTIYVYPKEAKGTIFFEMDHEHIIPWEMNKCCFHTKNILHTFENDSEYNKRFTINFFVNKKVL
jgi:hypothetical protein